MFACLKKRDLLKRWLGILVVLQNDLSLPSEGRGLYDRKNCLFAGVLWPKPNTPLSYTWGVTVTQHNLATLLTNPLKYSFNLYYYYTAIITGTSVRHACP